jgi:hypothetical protein
MIDEDWLKNLEFQSSDGILVTGLEGLGSEKVVFRATMSDGKHIVLKVYRHHLGFHIREIPLFLSDNKSLYDLNKVNQKLLRLLGNPLLDSWTCEYDRLYCSLIKLMHEFGLDSLMMSSAFKDIEMMGSIMNTIDLNEAISFIIHTPGIMRRLQDWASLPEKYNDPTEAILNVNGPNFQFIESRFILIKWAKETLGKIEKVSPCLKPSELPMNPLYVWGAAVMDGFFTDEELPQVVAFLNNQFGPLKKMPKAVIFLEQIKAISYLLSYFFKESKVQRLVEFCGLLGFHYQNKDRQGKI